MNLHEELLDAASCAGPELADLLRRAAEVVDVRQGPKFYYAEDETSDDFMVERKPDDSREWTPLYLRPAPIPDNMHLVPISVIVEARVAFVGCNIWSDKVSDALRDRIKVACEGLDKAVAGKFEGVSS